MSSGDHVIVVTSLSSEPLPISKRKKRERLLNAHVTHVSMSHQRLNDVKETQMPYSQCCERRGSHKSRKSPFRQQRKAKFPLNLSPSALFCEHLRQLQPRELQIPPPCSDLCEHVHRLYVNKLSTSKLRPLVGLATKSDVFPQNTVCKWESRGL